MKVSKVQSLRWFSCAAALGFMAGSALAQPVLTSLGATPGGISNPQGGTYYISGANSRWILNGGTLTYSGFGAAGAVYGGQISSDGAYQTCTLANNGAISGNTAGVTSPFAIPNAFAAYTLPAADPMTARFTAAGSTFAGLPGFANDVANQSQQVFGSGDVGGTTGWVHIPLGISHNGRFVAVQGYVSTYNTSTTSPGITSIVPSGGVATVQTAQAHLLAVGNQVTILGNLNSAFNGVQTVTGVPDATHFTFSTASSTTGPAGQMFFDIGDRVIATQPRIRGGVWDATTNTLRALPTPFRTTSQNTRRRDGSAYAVSDDGTVVVGAQEPFLGATATSADPDGPRLVVYRWNGSSYVMSYLPNGVDGSGFPITSYAILGGTVCMNGAGTIIAGPAVDNAGNAYVAKWVWNAGASAWNAPINLGYLPNPAITISSISPSGVTTSGPHGLAVNDWVYVAGNSDPGNNGWKQVDSVGGPTTFSFSGGMNSGTGGRGNKGASWLPYAITSTANTPTNPTASLPTLFVTGLSDDGNTIVGYAQYPTTNSIMNAGWIWTAGSGVIADWYDYLHGLGVAGVAPNDVWGPVGDFGDMTLGLPRIGNPSGISPDGSAIVGGVSGATAIADALPWVLRPNSAPACVPPVITLNPVGQNYSRCAGTGVVTQVVLNAAAGGTAPLTYQWYRGSTPLSDGTPGSSTITGSTTPQIRITHPGPADNGLYHCVVTGCNGTSATTADALVQNDPNTPTVGDTCAAAIACGEGATNFNVCGCYVNDGSAYCAPYGSTEYADIWFRYTPTFTGNARFQTCGTASTMNTTLEVLSGCNGTILGCAVGPNPRGLVGISCPSGGIIYSLPVTAGVPVLVRVSSISSFLNANGVLTISQAPPPPVNDLCANATPVGIGTYPFDLSDATDDFTFGTDICSGDSTQTFVSNRDIWYRLNSPHGGVYTISTCGSTVSNTMLHVMTDCSASNILACNDNAGNGVPGCGFAQSQIVNLAVTGPVLIRVSVGGVNKPNSGLGQLVITGTNNGGCGSADFNCDGDVGTDADIESFFACLAGTCPSLPCTSSADFNGDGDVGTDADIEAFFRVLSGGTC
jgi:hypothetical protein